MQASELIIKPNKTSRIMMSWLKLFLISIGVFILVACGGAEKEDLNTYIKETKRSAIKRAENAPSPKRPSGVIEKKVSYHVSATQREPFMSWVLAPKQVLKRSNKGPHPDEKRPKEVLEDYPLDSLRLVGTFTINGVDIALIKAPDGVVHRVKKGAYMGANYGKVMSITGTSLSLKEFVSDGLGGWRIRTTPLSLKENSR